MVAALNAASKAAAIKVDRHHLLTPNADQREGEAPAEPESDWFGNIEELTELATLHL
ncbi:MAG: hypothetical protein KY432_09725 [Acidobacteria bacterium]|nr:hypothetical protein [Acidobacteriota bacterium]